MNKQHMIDTFFTALARSEEKLHTTATFLPNFPRSIQLDYYSCGAKSTYMILRYYGKKCSPGSVERQLRTNINGTSKFDIKRVFRKYGLSVQVTAKMTLGDLKRTINAGSPVLVSVNDGWHYSVVYGYSDTHIFVMNPSLGDMGSLKVALRKDEWREVFDGWGVVVSQ